MKHKASLQVILKAGDTVVAEVEDPKLWQQVLAVINSSEEQVQGIPSSLNNLKTDISPQDNDPISIMASKLDVSRDQVIGAISPTTEAPFLRLDETCWEKMRKDAPKKGNNPINKIGMVATLLCLWFKEARIEGLPTQSMAHKVLKTVNDQDKNPSRGIKSTKWLQARPNGAVQINPAEMSEAIRVAASFCKKDWGK